MKKLATANLFVTSKRKSEKSPHQWANLTVGQDITIKAGSTISVAIWKHLQDLSCSNLAVFIYFLSCLEKLVCATYLFESVRTRRNNVYLQKTIY